VLILGGAIWGLDIKKSFNIIICPMQMERLNSEIKKLAKPEDSFIFPGFKTLSFPGLPFSWFWWRAELSAR